MRFGVLFIKKNFYKKFRDGAMKKHTINNSSAVYYILPYCGHKIIIKYIYTVLFFLSVHLNIYYSKQTGCLHALTSNVLTNKQYVLIS